MKTSCPITLQSRLPSSMSCLSASSCTTLPNVNTPLLSPLQHHPSHKIFYRDQRVYLRFYHSSHKCISWCPTVITTTVYIVIHNTCVKMTSCSSTCGGWLCSLTLLDLRLSAPAGFIKVYIFLINSRSFSFTFGSDLL